MRRLLLLVMSVIALGMFLKSFIAMVTEATNIVAVVTEVEKEDSIEDILKGVTVTFVEVKPKIPTTSDDVIIKYEVINEVPVATEEIFDKEEVLIEQHQEESVKEKYARWHTGVLTARKGYITDGPAGPNGNDGYETWYDLDMTRVVEIMDEFMEEKGKQDGCIYDYEYWVREDGCKMYGPYIMVAGDIANIRKRGDIVMTSLGVAIVCDYCEYSVKWNPSQIDIATDWEHTYSMRE